MFSSRLPRELTSNRLTAAVAQRRADGRPFLDLTGTNPTRAGILYPDDLLEPLADQRGLRYEPHPFGRSDARRAVADDYARHGIAISPERIVLTASTSEAYSLLFKLLADPGDEVLVPRPSYPLFDHLTMLDLVTARGYALEYHGEWTIDFASVERALGPRTRAVLLVSPNNPTGSFVSRAELDRLAAMCAPRGIAIIADEVFIDYELEPGARIGAGRPLAQTDALVFALGGLSKSIGLPHVKLGWIAVGGPDPLVTGALERLEIVTDTYLSVSTPVQVALGDLLTRGVSVRAQIADRVLENYRRLGAMLEPVPACARLKSSGGWSAVIQVPTFESEEDLVLGLLERDGVLTHPGYFFDFSRESFLVVSLLTPTAAFDEGIGRILRHFACSVSR